MFTSNTASTIIWVNTCKWSLVTDAVISSYEQAVVTTVKMTGNIMQFDNDENQTAIRIGVCDCLLKLPWVSSFFKAYWYPCGLAH